MPATTKGLIRNYKEALKEEEGIFNKHTIAVENNRESDIDTAAYAKVVAKRKAAYKEYLEYLNAH